MKPQGGRENVKPHWASQWFLFNPCLKFPSSAFFPLVLTAFCHILLCHLSMRLGSRIYFLPPFTSSNLGCSILLTSFSHAYSKNFVRQQTSFAEYCLTSNQSDSYCNRHCKSSLTYQLELLHGCKKTRGLLETCL